MTTSAHPAGSGTLAAVRLTRSAGKHGIGREEIRGVLAAPLRSVVQGDAVLHIGLTARRDLIEVVTARGEEITVLHAMRLRPANYPHMLGLSQPDQLL